MSTIDTSTWSPNSDLNVDIGGIPLNSDAGIAQTWQALRILMAAVKGDGDAIRAMISVMEGATASADGASGLVPKPLAGDQDKFLKGDGTWGNAPTPNLSTASRAVQTDANGVLAVSSVTATELGYLSGVTSVVQTQLDAKATDSAVVHLAGDETVGGSKTFSGALLAGSFLAASGQNVLSLRSATSTSNGAFVMLYTKDDANYPGYFRALARISSSTYSVLEARPDGTLRWAGNVIQTSSDERLKTPISAVPDAVLDAWEDVQWGQFQFLSAIGCKGESARLHLGLIAQRVKAAFEERGLDACQYGILCYEPEEDLWMVRYAEALAMEAACQRRRADRLEKRLAAVESRLTAMEVANA